MNFYTLKQSLRKKRRVTIPKDFKILVSVDGESSGNDSAAFVSLCLNFMIDHSDLFYQDVSH